jgi:hypothetical protein
VLTLPRLTSATHLVLLEPAVDPADEAAALRFAGGGSGSSADGGSCIRTLYQVARLVCAGTVEGGILDGMLGRAAGQAAGAAAHGAGRSGRQGSAALGVTELLELLCQQRGPRMLVVHHSRAGPCW